MSSCRVVVECLPEILTAKQRMLSHVEPHLAPDAVFASATSSLPASAIGARALRPGRVAVAHYVWPANRMPLVEVAFPDGVDDGLPDVLLDLLHAQGKQPLVVRDVPGFLITRAIMAYWSETVDALAEGISPVAIDSALEARGWPMGACRLIDGTSISSIVAIAGVLRSVLGERASAFDRLSPLLAAGYAGFTAGAGLYLHSRGSRAPNDDALSLLRNGNAKREAPDDIADRVMGALVREVDRCIDEGVVDSWEDAALGIDLAYGFPGGLLAYAAGIASPETTTRRTT